MKALGIVVSLLLLAGCTGGNSDDEDAGGASAKSSQAADQAVGLVETLPTTAEPVWSTRLEPLRQPVVAGDVLIAVVAARGDDVDVVALDRADGAVLWRKPLMVVDTFSGPSLGTLVYESAAGESYVVMQEAGEGGQAVPYLAIEPRTGKVVARTRPVVAQSGARVCDDGHDACLQISADSYDATRWVLGSWALRQEKKRWPDGGERFFNSTDVYSVFDSDSSFFGVTAIGRVGSSAWRVPSRKITQGRGWEIDYNSGFVDEEAGVVVVPIAHLSGETISVRGVLQGELSRYRTVGLDVESGEVLWRHDETGLLCLNLSRWEDVPVRCFIHGVASDQAGRGDTAEPRRAWLEGFDPLTGETTWQEDLDPAVVRSMFRRPLSADTTLTSSLAAEDLAVVSSVDGVRLLSLVDGSSRPVEGAEVLLCPAPVSFGESTDSESRGFGVAVPCTPSGKRLGRAQMAKLGPVGLLTGAVDVGDGLRAVSTASSIEAFRLS